MRESSHQLRLFFCAWEMIIKQNTTVLILCHRFVQRGGWDWDTCSICLKKKKNSSSGEWKTFFLLSPACWGASLVICSDWMIHVFMLTSRGLLQQLFVPAIRWVFPLLLRSNAPQCVLSTKTALSCLSAKRQKCCAATLPSAVWLSVAEHLCVPPLTDWTKDNAVTSPAVSSCG